MCHAEAWLFFLRGEPGGDGIQIRTLPERFGQRRESQRRVEALGALDDRFGLGALEILIQAGFLDQSRPALRPPVAHPVGRQRLRNGPIEPLGQRVFRPAMQSLVKRSRRLRAWRRGAPSSPSPSCRSRRPAGRRTTSTPSLVRPDCAALEIGEARFQGASDLLRRRPDALPLAEIA